MKCSICIATCNRQQGLLKLLDSLSLLQIPEGVDVEWIIVDNTVTANAHVIVENFRGRVAVPMQYFVQPIKNISLTRNLAVTHATGEYILFIDDDEMAQTDWLQRHISTAVQYGADGVFGPVLPIYHPTTPQWICRGRFFEEPYATPATGTVAQAMWSGNCLLRKSILDLADGPFTPAYGLTGGEDTYLFEGLQRNGAYFIYCAEAIVYESVPQNRTTLLYLIKRGFKGGNLYSRRLIETATSHKTLTRLALFCKAGCYAGISLAMALFSIPYRATAGRWMIRVASNAGKLCSVFNVYPQHYQVAFKIRPGVK
jgi:succinoglycan biosynthesis protein ExoM